MQTKGTHVNQHYGLAKKSSSLHRAITQIKLTSHSLLLFHLQTSNYRYSPTPLKMTRLNGFLQTLLTLLSLKESGKRHCVHSDKFPVCKFLFTTEASEAADSLALTLPSRLSGCPVSALHFVSLRCCAQMCGHWFVYASDLAKKIFYMSSKPTCLESLSSGVSLFSSPENADHAQA